MADSQAVRAVILDRDGVLNKRLPTGHYVCNWQEFQWLSGSKEALRLLTDAGYKIIIATNQSGIARGVFTEEDLSEIHEHMAEEMRQAGATLDRVYHCPHGTDDGCACRKPRPGLIHQAQRDFGLDLENTLFIGDEERDMQAGNAAGCRTELVTDRRCLLTVIQEYLNQVNGSSI